MFICCRKGWKENDRHCNTENVNVLFGELLYCAAFHFSSFLQFLHCNVLCTANLGQSFKMKIHF